MEIVTHLREVEVSIENISSHVMRIRTRKSDTIESIYGIYLIEEFSKWRLENLLCKGGARRAEDFYLLYETLSDSF